MKYILITGVAGLLGSRLGDWICNHHPEYKVIGIDDLSGGYRENIHPSINFLQFNLLDRDKVEECFRTYRPEYVFHFAAYAAEGLSPFIRSYNYKNNLVATSHIVNGCINYDVKRLVFTSSMAVYGRGSGERFDESQIPAPIDPYGVAKYACEMDIGIAGEQHGLDWCIIRPHNVYGIHQNIWDKYRNVIGIWMYQYLNNQSMTIFGDGEQKRAFSYIDDCLNPLWKAAVSHKASKEIINLGGIRSVTINKANKILRKVIGGGEVEYHEARHEVKHAIPTYKKSMDLLDFKHITDMEPGIENMWNWVKNQPQRKRKEWDSFEVQKLLYSFWLSDKDQ